MILNYTPNKSEHFDFKIILETHCFVNPNYYKNVLKNITNN